MCVCGGGGGGGCNLSYSFITYLMEVIKLIDHNIGTPHWATVNFLTFWQEEMSGNVT